MDRAFAPGAQDRLWVADFTYVPTWTGMVYVAFVIDAFARRMIGWRRARSMKTSLVLDGLERAFFTRGQEGITDLTGLVSHSDALDNALAETTVGSYKNELIWREGPGATSTTSRSRR